MNVRGPRDSLCCELPHQDFHCTSPPYWNIPFIYLLIQSITSCSCGLVSLHKDLLAPYPHWTDGRVVWDFWKMFSILTARLFECSEHMGVALGPGFSYHPLPLLVCAVHAFMLSRPLIQWHFFFCCPQQNLASRLAIVICEMPWKESFMEHKLCANECSWWSMWNTW